MPLLIRSAHSLLDLSDSNRNRLAFFCCLSVQVLTGSGVLGVTALVAVTVWGVVTL